MLKTSKDLNNREKFIGQRFNTSRCGECVVIDYLGTHNVTVSFEEPCCVVTCRMTNLRKGQVNNPLKPSFYGVGFIGIGDFGIKDRRAIELWSSILERCYEESFWIKNPSYKDVTVCNEWLNFQNFAEWCYSQKFFNAKDTGGRYYQLDKDILVKGNKIYSPETCYFVPSCINTLLISRKKLRGNLPVGVFLEKKTGKFGAQVQDGSGKQKKLGQYTTPEEAFLAYKVAKEARIKSMAKQWRCNIDSEIYEALLAYEVRIED